MIVRRYLHGKNLTGNKKVLVISGVHGNETHAVAATYQLYENMCKFNSSEIGKIDFIFNLNEYGLEQDTRDNLYAKETSTNLNRLFPKEYNTPDEIKDYLKKIVNENYDLILDVHNSPCCLDCVLIDYDENTNKLLGVLKDSPLEPMVRPTQIGTIKKLFNKYSYAYTVELGEMGIRGDYKASAELLRTFIETVIGNMKDKKTVEVNQDCVVKTLCTKIDNGIIRYERANVVGYYEEGDPICTVKNMHTSEVEYIEAPFDGILFDVDDNIYSYSGKEFGMFGRKIEIA